LCRETSLAAVLASHSSMEICWCGAHQLAQGDHITNVLGSQVEQQRMHGDKHLADILHISHTIKEW